MFEICVFQIKGYSNPKEHYTMCFVEIYRRIPSSMAEIY